MNAAPGQNPEADIPTASDSIPSDIGNLAWRSSLNKTRRRLLEARCADLTVGQLRQILRELDRGESLEAWGFL
jgi:hypothetical protein